MYSRYEELTNCITIKNEMCLQKQNIVSKEYFKNFI